MTGQYKRAQQIRSGARWQKCRKLKLSHDPVCEYCQKKPSMHVHHIKPVSECPELAHTQSNLMALCERCHQGIEAAAKRGITVQDLKELFSGD